MEDMIQVLLERKDGNCLLNMVCWLPAEPRVKTGAVISLKEQEGRWKIKEMYHRAKKSDIKGKWKVGGLV